MAKVRLVVVDSGPCIALARVQLLHTLVEAFDEVVVPKAVHDELLGGSHLDDAWRVIQLVNSSIVDRQPSALVNPSLGLGERTTLSVALETGAHVLVDDRRARSEAQRLGLRPLGTLAVLRIAHHRGILLEMRRAALILLNSGYHLPLLAINQMLVEVGEELIEQAE